MLHGHKRCLLVGEEYVFLLEKNICLLVGEEYVFLLEKNIWIWKMSSYSSCLVLVLLLLLKTFQGALRLAAGVVLYLFNRFLKN